MKEGNITNFIISYSVLNKNISTTIIFFDHVITFFIVYHGDINVNEELKKYMRHILFIYFLKIK